MSDSEVAAGNARSRCCESGDEHTGETLRTLQEHVAVLEAAIERWVSWLR